MHGPTCIFWANLTPCSLKWNPWHRNVTCGNGGFRCAVAAPIDAPCTDVAALSIGAQNMTLDFSALPSAWLGGTRTECDVFGVFTTPTQPAAKGVALGRFKSAAFTALVPPHGSRFLILSNCG
jgi:hypothetical protein